jgi:Fe-S cluster biosynthesis and repair protein YggX
MSDKAPGTIHCRRCDDDRPELPRPPFRNEVGERVQAEICQFCWQEWLQHQTLLINHYGLDPRDQKSKDFLYRQVEEVLLGDGTAEQVDTTKQGEIEW